MLLKSIALVCASAYIALVWPTRALDEAMPALKSARSALVGAASHPVPQAVLKSLPVSLLGLSLLATGGGGGGGAAYALLLSALGDACLDMHEPALLRFPSPTSRAQNGGLPLPASFFAGMAFFGAAQVNYASALLARRGGAGRGPVGSGPALALALLVGASPVLVAAASGAADAEAWQMALASCVYASLLAATLFAALTRGSARAAAGAALFAVSDALLAGDIFLWRLALPALLPWAKAAVMLTYYSAQALLFLAAEDDASAPAPARKGARAE